MVHKIYSKKEIEEAIKPWSDYLSLVQDPSLADIVIKFEDLKPQKDPYTSIGLMAPIGASEIGDKAIKINTAFLNYPHALSAEIWLTYQNWLTKGEWVLAHEKGDDCVNKVTYPSLPLNSFLEARIKSLEIRPLKLCEDCKKFIKKYLIKK